LIVWFFEEVEALDKVKALTMWALNPSIQSKYHDKQRKRTMNVSGEMERLRFHLQVAFFSSSQLILCDHGLILEKNNL
jgi:hypothetical protein